MQNTALSFTQAGIEVFFEKLRQKVGRNFSVTLGCKISDIIDSWISLEILLQVMVIIKNIVYSLNNINNTINGSIFCFKSLLQTQQFLFIFHAQIRCSKVDTLGL